MMTTGTNSRSNHHPLYPRDDREALSALFDGELPGDSARFTLKRLDHDAQWQETCGRWQLIGDALRGEATSAARPGFADGVMRALAAEARASSAVPAPVRERSAERVRRRWLGGAALAASVAVASVLVVRPFSQSTPAPQVAAEAASPAPATTGAMPLAAPQATGRDPDPVAAIAVADATPSTVSGRALRATRPAARTVRSPAAAATAVEQPAAVLAAAAQPASRQPFHPPADDIVTRPWPRSALSEASAAGALTVGFGSGATTSPSLYPFEPRLQPESQAPRSPQPVEQQR